MNGFLNLLRDIIAETTPTDFIPVDSPPHYMYVCNCTMLKTAQPYGGTLFTRGLDADGNCDGCHTPINAWHIGATGLFNGVVSDGVTAPVLGSKVTRIDPTTGKPVTA